MFCRVCNEELVKRKNWSDWLRCRKQLICSPCNKLEQKQKKTTDEKRKEYSKSYNKTYYEFNKDRLKSYYQSNKYKYKERSEKTKPQVQLRNYALKVKACNAVGECRCCICGETDIRVLQINHKNGRNNENDKGQELYSIIIKGIRTTEDLDVRCANCNLLYEYERGNKQFPLGAELHPSKQYEPFTFC